MVTDTSVFDQLYKGDFSELETLRNPKPLSSYATSFVRKLVCMNPWSRMSADEAIQHPWLHRHIDELEDIYQRAIQDWTNKELTRDFTGYEEDEDVAMVMSEPGEEEEEEDSDEEMQDGAGAKGRTRGR